MNLSLIATAFLLVIALDGYAQSKKLEGSYVATKVIYQNGEELEDANVLKYTYTKYTFGPSGQLNVSTAYEEKGSPFKYAVNRDRFTIKSTTGSVLNVMKILELSPAKLVLVSGSVNGLDDPYAIKYTFHNEQLVQHTMPLTSGDIHSVRGADTVFQSGQKVYPVFVGNSFRDYIYGKLDEKKLGVSKGVLISTFIVDENGSPGSLKIIQGINPEFDAAYIKAFHSSIGQWQPATFNGKKVKVMMKQTLKYSTVEETMPAYFDTQKGNAAYNAGDFETALYFYNEVIERLPEEIIALYRRGICRLALGNQAGACEDWSAIKELGSPMADELLLKYCN